MEAFFWANVLFVVYVYLGYPFLLFVLNRVRPPVRLERGEVTPTVSMIIPAHNEEKCIASKIENSLVLDYPSDRLEVIVASDGSRDRTPDIVREYQARGVKLLDLYPNRGKSSAQNAAVHESSAEIIFFTDANAMLRPDALGQLLGYFADPQVGCVVGRVTYVNQGETAVSDGEGLYWHYELFLRRMESQLGNFAMGSGPIMAIRRELFQTLDPNVGEDFVLPMQVALKGFRVVYEPDAVSEEVLFQVDPGTMHRSKVRIISKDLRGLFSSRAILNPLRHPLYAWGLISHKLLRWLVPFFMLIALVANVSLVDSPFYFWTLGMQVGFYTLALAGHLCQLRGSVPRLLGIPFSLCLVNLAAFVGVLQFATGKQAGRWLPVRQRRVLGP